jgi:hypothetical protein
MLEYRNNLWGLGYELSERPVRKCQDTHSWRADMTTRLLAVLRIRGILGTAPDPGILVSDLQDDN